MSYDVPFNAITCTELVNQLAETAIMRPDFTEAVLSIAGINGVKEHVRKQIQAEIEIKSMLILNQKTQLLTGKGER